MAQTPDARTAGEMVEHSASAPEHHCPKDRRRYVLAAATTVSALGFIDGSVLSVALAAIRSDLPASFAEVQWVSNAYVLTLAALILVGGAAGDRFGQRNTLVVGLIIFIVSSMVCGLAPNASVLIGARLVEGIGAALMVPGSLALIARNYPKAERPAAIGIWAAISGIAAAIGPLIGGLVLSWGGDPAWRWLFYMNVPLGLFAVWLLLARVPVDPAVAGERLDWAGAVLVTGALACLAYGLTAISGGASLVATSFWLMGGLVLLAGFLRHEIRTPHAMMPLRLFADRAFAGANLLTFLLYFALSGVLFFLPMALITGLNATEALAGGVFLPFSIIMALVSRWASTLVNRMGLASVMAIGCVVTAIAFAALGGSVRASMLEMGVFPAMALLGAGMGLVVSPLSIAVMAAVDESESGLASGVNNAVSRIAGLIAVAALAIVVSAVYAWIAGASLPQLPGFGSIMPDANSPALAALHRKATVSAFFWLCLVTALLCMAAAATAWATQPNDERSA